jgi:cell division septum initiation protein DivIVA
MESLSSRYGWTPDEIRGMDEVDVRQYLEIIAEEYKLKKADQMRYGNR